MDCIAYSAAFDSIGDFKIFAQNYALMSSFSAHGRNGSKTIGHPVGQRPGAEATHTHAHQVNTRIVNT